MTKYTKFHLFHFVLSEASEVCNRRDADLRYCVELLYIVKLQGNGASKMLNLEHGVVTHLR